MEPHDGTIISLSLHDNNLFWLYSLSANQKAAPWTCCVEENICKDRKELPVLLENPQIIKAYKDMSSTKNRLKNPCKTNNGGCSDFCLISSNNSRSCACRVGYELESDLQSCKPVTDFIMYIKRNYVRAISVSSKKDDVFKDIIVPTIIMENLYYQERYDFDYDLQNDNFYFYDFSTVKVMKVRSYSEPKILFNTDGPCYDIFFDWTSNNFYYRNTDSILMVHLRSIGLIVDTVSFFDVSPFVIDVYEGRIFYYLENSGIGGSNMPFTPASRVTNVVKTKNYRNFQSLALDHDENTIYFMADGLVFYKHLNDSNFNVTLAYEEKINAKSLIVHKEHLYLWNSNQIWRAHKKNYGNMTQITTSTGNETLHGMKVFSTAMYTRMTENKCAINNGDCEQFCFSRPKNTCGCRRPYTVLSNGSCVV